MKLPKTGFVFPDTSYIDTGVVGHRKCADRYIIEHNLIEELKEYGGESDDFLIEKLGAIKVCHWRGTSYIFAPKKHGWYINEIIKLYEEQGYKLEDCYINDIVTEKEQRELFNNYHSYNQTIVETVDKKGKILYKYNPRRDGD